jgi:putative ABC transport system permease protein
MTSLTVLHVMGSDPIPWKSDKLHYVQLDNWDPNQPYDEESGNPPDQVTYRDAQALMEAGKADKQAAMFKVAYPIQPENPEVKPFLALGRATYGDFFAMFEPPFQYGGGWDHAQDSQHGRVVVLSKETNEKLFGGQDSVGKKVRMNEIDYTVVGVLGYWRPRIKYYDLTNGTLNDPEEFYLPYTTVIETKATRPATTVAGRIANRAGKPTSRPSASGSNSGCSSTRRHARLNTSRSRKTTSTSRRNSGVSRDR